MEQVLSVFVPLTAVVCLLPRPVPAQDVAIDVKGSLYTQIRRLAVVACILLTFVLSHYQHGHRYICPKAPGFGSEPEVDCFLMTGLFGFSTYTRWSFILIGVSELLLALGPLRYSHTYLILSQIAFGNSLLVTFVSYTFLVPGVVFIRTDSSHDTERALLTSATAHIMHLANAVVCFLEWRYLSKIPAVVQSSFHVTAPTPTGCFMSTTISDSLRAKLLFDCTYVTFALTFVTTHGIVFYPFLNPHNPSTPIAILVLIAVAVGLWVCCRKVVTSLHGPQSKMTKHA